MSSNRCEFLRNLGLSEKVLADLLALGFDTPEGLLCIIGAARDDFIAHFGADVTQHIETELLKIAEMPDANPDPPGSLGAILFDEEPPSKVN